MKIQEATSLESTVAFQSILDDAAARREQERERIWSLFLPIGAGVIALVGYILFHLPALDIPTLIAIVVFASLLYIPLDAIVGGALRLLYKPIVLVDQEQEETVLRRFRKLHASWRTEDLHILGEALAYMVSGIGAFAVSLGTDDPILKYILWLGTLVFFISPGLSLVRLPARGRKPKKLSRRLKRSGRRAVLFGLKALKWPFIIGFGAATFFAIESGLAEDRPSGMALAAILGAVLLLLAATRIWLTLAADKSLGLIQDLRYRMACGELSERDAKYLLEAIDILRNNDASFEGTAKEMLDLMGPDYPPIQPSQSPPAPPGSPAR